MIYGRVVGFMCRKEGGEWIRKFRLTTDDVVYHCRTKLFLPLMDSDIVVVNDNDKLERNGENIIMHWPYVKIDFEEGFIANYITPALKNVKDSVRMKVYYYLRDVANSSEAEAIANYVEDLVRFTRADNVPMEQELVTKHLEGGDYNEFYGAIKALVKWFKRNVCLRRFRLLGLKDTDVRTLLSFHEMETYVLYNRVLTNPFLLYPLGYDVCVHVANVVRWKADPFYFAAGKAIIAMHKYVEDGWTCVDERLVPFITEHKDFFISEYELKSVGNFLYFPITYKVEMGIAEWVKGLKDIATLNLEAEGVTEQVFQQPLSIVVGEAGTGKTTLIADIIKKLIAKRVNYHVCSFTGKAVQRVMCVVSDKGLPMDSRRFSTIHRLIAMKKQDIKFLIVDEVSMVSMPLFHALIKKYPNVQTLLVGDPNQLEPIEWGHMLESIVHANSIPIIKLSTNYRQSKGGLYTSIETVMRSGTLTPTDSMALIPCMNSDIYTEVKNIMTFIHSNLPDDKCMILCPYTYLLKQINDDVRSIVSSGQYVSITDKWNNTFYVNDRVMLTRNIKGEECIYNGDEGVVLSVGNSITVKWDRTGTTTTFDTNPAEEEISLDPLDAEDVDKITKHLAVSYAITCHKAQGSEWDGVIIVLPYHKANPSFVNKRMIYTAITRARKYCYIVGDIKALQRAIKGGTPCSSTLLPYHIDN